jgi:catalase
MRYSIGDIVQLIDNHLAFSLDDMLPQRVIHVRPSSCCGSLVISTKICDNAYASIYKPIVKKVSKGVSILIIYD